MVLLLVKSGLSNEHREVAVLDTECLDLGIKEIGDLFPNEVSRWSQNVASTNIVVLDEV